MEVVGVVAILVGLDVVYFCFGIAIRFLWGWWILVASVPACVFVGFVYGWVGAIIAIFGFFLALHLNNEWHDAALFGSISRQIDKMFYFDDT